ncbi:MAG: hypothetical protein ACRDNK_06115 [Solirubrobacteraceae bacterium]
MGRTHSSPISAATALRTLLAVLGAAVVLVALGAVWLSVRGQHPYKGPAAAGLVVMYGILVCWIVVVVAFKRRATAGVSGRSIRQERAYGAAVVTALVGVSVPGSAEARRGESGDRLRDLPGNLMTHLRKLEDAEYLTTEKARQRACVANLGSAHAPRRAALDTYAETLRRATRRL